MRAWCCGVALLIASSASADPLTINLLSHTHTVTVTTVLHDNEPFRPPVETVVTRTTTSHSTGVSDVEQVDSLHAPFLAGSTATADLFDVSTSTRSDYVSSDDVLWSAEAFATTTWLFAPVVDGVGSMGLEFAYGGGNPVWTEAAIRLDDVTTGHSLWTYGWSWVDFLTAQATIAAVPISVTTLFDTSHLYALTMTAHSQANMDSQVVTARVTGVQTVPEPATLLLLVTGLCGLRFARRT